MASTILGARNANRVNRRTQFGRTPSRLAITATDSTRPASKSSLDRSGEGVGDRDSHARVLGAPGPQAQEENLEPRLETSVGSRCEGREDERWPDAPGPQSRACGDSKNVAIWL